MVATSHTAVLRHVFASLALGLVLVVAAGCRTEPMVDETPAAETGDETSSLDAEIEAALAQLSPEDRAAAEKQKICPVGKGPLGSMGTPPKVEINGREVFLCCEGCEDTLRSDPEKYLANLDSETP